MPAVAATDPTCDPDEIVVGYTTSDKVNVGVPNAAMFSNDAGLVVATLLIVSAPNVTLLATLAGATVTAPAVIVMLPTVAVLLMLAGVAVTAPGLTVGLPKVGVLTYELGLATRRS